MLLRSTSTPVLRTLVCQSSTSRPVSMCLQRTASETEIKPPYLTRERMFSKRSFMSPVLKEKEEMSVCTETVEEEEMVCGGGGGGVGVGGICGGGGGGSWDSGHQPYESDHESMNLYYQNMIKAYPGDALLLANYAKFLKEVRGDVVKAEEFCEKAILANGRDDGNVLSMYGDLIWNNHKDSNRAQAYFDQAVKSSPDDCYVLASYAHFLWDAGEEDGDEEEETRQNEVQCDSLPTYKQIYNLPQGFPPLAAAS
ncbi:PREDICTED: uncharacterized protein LOC105136156 [Populus euphratica]|uniref:Uncharacterized protein LOC105136156 n=1 Tax=Populus euphratica TaxID=75702 RepID=A0AAJ6V1V8_POPEU|nr:PREDICTED: uncharacterized protein LOC105136156 [Populus euphratica]